MTFRVEKIEVIPHGIPDFPFVEPDLAKVKLGFTAKPVILTFGLLSPNKGIEVVIDAMPLILKSRPDAVYVVLGATHPNLVRQEGEAYRESLMARARELGVQDNVVFLDQFVDQPTLLDFISMCDVYVTPYLNEAQMTSGTLAYSFGLGKAVVSTPYWHARELLADGRGVLVPFHDSAAIGTEISGLLTDDARRQAMRMRAYSDSRSMTWKRIGERYHAVFDAGPPQPSPECDRKSGQKSTGKEQRRAAGHADRPSSVHVRRYRPVSARHSFDTGPVARLLHRRQRPRAAAGLRPQHRRRGASFRSLDGAAGRVPSACLESGNAAVPELHELRPCLAGRKRLGRQPWAHLVGPGRMRAQRYQPVAPPMGRGPVRRGVAGRRSFSFSARLGFSLLGLDAYCSVVPDNALAARLRRSLADRLISILASVETRKLDLVRGRPGL